MSEIALRDVPQGFSGLHSLLGGDARNLNLAARAFYRSVQVDLARMEKAAQEGDWSEVSMLARRIAMVCAQVSEHRAALAMASLARLRRADAMRAEYDRYRSDLTELAGRAMEFSKHYEARLGQ
jgi:hypothetical protein